ncbi:MAG: SAM-dependent methyltransferase [Verrucomicrobia bacterium GWC2_42_7]|nr:MAG: SAM-dependent methyltransferase [Verrucomicrobia bacterium GWC2_42_7]
MKEQKTRDTFRAGPFEYHQEIELTVDTLTNLGVGLGRVDGWVVMVPFSLPGERVRARIFRNHKNYSEADLIEVTEPSPHRVQPKCDLFGNCGGCQYQHLSYEQQLKWKQQQVKEIFAHLAGIETAVNPPLSSEQTFHYRSKITPHFNKPTNEVDIGFLKQGQRHALVDVEQCVIATERINSVLPCERQALKSNPQKFKRGGTLLLRDTMDGIMTNPKAPCREKIGEWVFHFTAGEFFQNNPFVLPKMIDYVVKQASAGGAEYLVDAYCGVGVFAIAAHSLFKEVVGIEVNSEGIKWAHKNALSNHATNCSFIEGNAENIFTNIAVPGNKTAIIIDPPRKGCDEAFIQQLLAFAPARIVYVSCAPDTQARDLKTILQSHPYKLVEVQPIDLFPQTRHIENVCVLERV